MLRNERVELLEEPKLIFGNNRACNDPKVGLLCYGPSGLDTDSGQNRVIRGGVIGTYAAISHLKEFLSRLSYVIPTEEVGKTRPWRIEFPGLSVKGPLSFAIELDPNAIEYITESEERQALDDSVRRVRIDNAASLYEQKFQDLANTVHPAPNIVFLPFSARLVRDCKDPAYKTDRIVYERRTMEEGDDYFAVPLFDFHHVLKVFSFKHSLTCQVLLPATMSFSQSRQDPATIAWNFATAVYYKGTGIPWKLADLDDKTCLVGISFYEEIGEQGANMRASMAHVYVKSAESQIIRGKAFPWKDSDRKKQPHLTSEQAQDLLNDVIDLFRRQREINPSRVVVHKSSPFTKDEIQGFNESSKGVSVVDYVHIESISGLRFFHRGQDYPPVRGTLVGSTQGSPAILYTVGFVPCLGTYLGSTIPHPLLLHFGRLDSTPREISKDILSLSKLDWNSTDFCSRNPVTTSVSRKVGHVLAEMRARDVDPPQQYRYYM